MPPGSARRSQVLTVAERGGEERLAPLRCRCRCNEAGDCARFGRVPAHSYPDQVSFLRDGSRARLGVRRCDDAVEVDLILLGLKCAVRSEAI